MSVKVLFRSLLAGALLVASSHTFAEIVLEKEIQITDTGLFFDGEKVTTNRSDPAVVNDEKYHYYFGNRISPHGDSIKKLGDYVFMTWYRGGKNDRHVMLTRYNMVTGSLKTIEFPHQHTGYQNQWWIGESHNTIAVGVSPVDGTIHLLYDMHAYGSDRPSDGSLANDYFRYSYSKPGAANVPDDEFTLDQFVKDTSFNSEGDSDYKHITLTGEVDYEAFSGLTYPGFFLNTDGTLLMYMRKGGNNNGGYKFARYYADNKTWSDFLQFNVVDAKSYGMDYNWGLYGSMKYVNGKLRVGFQRRSSNNNDKYLYQNGFYYAYSDHPDGVSDWKNHRGEAVETPLVDADDIKVSEPGDLVSTTAKNQVYIVHGFDWNVTERGDVHLIGSVKDTENNVTVKVHTYKPAGEAEFITSTDFSGADEIYTAGNNIYIIGLNSSGRPYIEKAEGGTNKFTRVYEQTDGREFRHGNVYIDDGKLYFYLMEKGEGSAQPVYLQIIDLDLDATEPAPQPEPQPEPQPGPDPVPLPAPPPDSNSSGGGGSLNFVLLLCLGLLSLMRRKARI
ncbi:hypothetical protein DXV75_12935 [Alteromonas aestuariivivens]|uniref:GlyGly-CTERM sorting domain-containing protein n=2 Tax=Alteromonas aestuariivivens TaxID=1938339 RepID=A0A3D8M4M7_9ALTE|nr:hypothetical protein DXV75_12935 [Alteromonas aestuariivivens]